MHGFDGASSTNPNAICLHKILNHASVLKAVEVITTTSEERRKEKVEGIFTHYIPINRGNDGRLDFRQWRREVEHYVAEEISFNKFTHLLTISFPFDIQMLGLALKKKHPSLRWFIYELDPFAYNRVLRLRRFMFPYRLIREMLTFSHSDKIFLTHELYKQYSQTVMSRYDERYVEIGIPALKISPSKVKVQSDNDYIDLIYAGSFYKKIRQPGFMFKVFKCLVDRGVKVRLHIYGSTDSVVPEECAEMLGSCLFVYGRVAPSVVSQVIAEHNVLVSVGNSVENQLPSKVLEYIGTGKPIIHFYSITNDPAKRYLADYPNCIIVQENHERIDKTADDIHGFLKTNANVILSASKLEEMYADHTIEAVVARIELELKESFHCGGH